MLVTVALHFSWASIVCHFGLGCNAETFSAMFNSNDIPKPKLAFCHLRGLHVGGAWEWCYLCKINQIEDFPQVNSFTQILSFLLQISNSWRMTFPLISTMHTSGGFAFQLEPMIIKQLAAKDVWYGCMVEGPTRPLDFLYVGFFDWTEKHFILPGSIDRIYWKSIYVITICLIFSACILMYITNIAIY